MRLNSKAKSRSPRAIANLDDTISSKQWSRVAPAAAAGRAKFTALLSGGLLLSAAVLGGCEDEASSAPGPEASASTSATTTTTVSASATSSSTSTATGTSTSTGAPADDSTPADDSMADDAMVDDTDDAMADDSMADDAMADDTDDSTVDDSMTDDADDSMADDTDDSTVDDAMADDTDDSMADDTDDSMVDDTMTDDAMGGAGGAGPTDAGLEGGLPPLDYDAGDAGDAGDAAPEAGPVDASTPDAAMEAAVDASPETEASVEPEAGPEPDPEPEAGVPASDLTVSCVYPENAANPLQLQFIFTNNSSSAFDMSNATVSYYFDDTASVGDLNLVVYSGPLGANASPSNVTSQVIANPNPTTGADYIARLSVGASCPDWSPCSIAANATTEAMSVALTRSSGSFDTDQHYSFAPLQNDPCEFVVVEIGGEVVFGLPPATN